MDSEHYAVRMRLHLREKLADCERQLTAAEGSLKLCSDDHDKLKEGWQETKAQLTAERERCARLREALERAIQGYRNLIEVGALPHDGWDDETEKLIIHFRDALAADEAVDA